MTKKFHNPLMTGKSASQRQLRVAEELKHALSTIFLRGDFNAEGLRNWFGHHLSLTITYVSMSPDLKNAKIYVVPLGTEAAYTAIITDESSPSEQLTSKQLNKKVVQLLIHSLNDAISEVRYLMAQKIQLRYVPAIKFYADETFDNAQRLEQLFDEAAARDKKPPLSEDEDSE